MDQFAEFVAAVGLPPVAEDLLLIAVHRQPTEVPWKVGEVVQETGELFGSRRSHAHPSSASVAMAGTPRNLSHFNGGNWVSGFFVRQNPGQST